MASIPTVHFWKPRGHTRLGWHRNSYPFGSTLTVSLRWLMVRVTW